MFVINPKSGAKRNIDWQQIISEYFRQLNHTIDFFQFSKNESNQLKKTIQKFGPDKVIAVGGDGTVTFVAEQLLGSAIQMGIIPAGSANGMAKELEIPSEVNKALEIVLGGKIRHCDVILINEKQISLHLSDIGMNAELINLFKARKLRGMLGYASVAMKVLLRQQRMKVVIETKGEEVLRSAVMVAFANASKYGTGAIINPEGDLEDGLFEVVIVRKFSIIEVLKMFLKLQRFNPKKIEVLTARTATIETSRKMHFQIDGEYLGKVNSVKARILPAQLNILTPANNEETKNEVSKKDNQ